MTEPRLTVILCNYNHAQYLPESLAAICGQSRRPDEFIVVDDGSSDQSADIISRFAERFPFVDMIRNTANQGVVKSGNHALSRATGDYVAWFSADDIVLPGMFADVVEAIRRSPEVGVVATETIIEPDGDQGNSRTYNFNLADGKVFLSPENFVGENKGRYLWLASSGLFVRRDALLEAGGWREELDWFCDWFAVYVIAMRHGAACISKPYSVIRDRPESYGSLAKNDPKRRDPVIRGFFDLLRSPEFSDARRLLRQAPMMLIGSLEKPLFGHLWKRPADWDLLWSALLANALYHIDLKRRIMSGRPPP